MAQSVSIPDFEVNAENKGDVIVLPFTLTMPDGGDFTNIETHVTFPAGIRPALVTYDDDDNLVVTEDPDEGFYCEVGPDIEVKQKLPVVAYTDNFDEPSNYPAYVIVGANMKKVANTKNPNNYMIVYAIADEDYEAGERAFTAYVKYTQYDDASFTVGALDAEVPICNVTFVAAGPGPQDGVDDVNAAKAVSSVKYYNAAGVASDNAFEGVNIVVTKYADGSQSVVKVVK